MEIPTADQIARLYAASEPRMRAFIALCAFAGLRLGEASAIQRQDIDFLRRSLEVRRQVQRRVGGPAELRAPKYGSERVLNLPESLVQLLAAQIERFGVASEGWVFFTADGRPLPPSTVNSWWQRTVEVVRCQVHITEHRGEDFARHHRMHQRVLVLQLLVRLRLGAADIHR